MIFTPSPYGCRKPTTNPRYVCQYHNRARGYSATKYSVLALAPETTIPDTQFTQYRTLTWYCKQKYITKKIARTLIKKRWLCAIKHGRHIYVAEKCPEQINQYLGIS